MILDQLYTTDVTSGTLKLTARLEDIPIDTEEFTPAYWLGYIKNTNLPQVFYASKVDISGTGDEAVLSFTDASDWSVYRDVGYFGQTDSSHFTMVDCYYSENVEKWMISQGSLNKYARLINDMFYQEFSFKNLTLTFAYKTAGKSSDTDFNAQNVAMTISEFIDFCNGEDITLTVDGNTVTFNVNMFNDDYIAYVGENSDIPLFIANYQFNSYMYSSNTNQDSYIVPFVSVPFNDGENAKTNVKCCTNSLNHQMSASYTIQLKNLANAPQIVYAGSSLDGTTDFNAPRYINGAYATFTVQELNALTSSDRPAVSGNVVCFRRTYFGNAFYFFGVALNPNLILKHAGLFRWGTHTGNINTVGYVEDDVYYPEVNLTTNEFTGNLLTGDEAYVKPRIPIWMKYEVSENDYDPADKPDPEPPVPTDSEESGDPINIQIRAVRGATNFITQYAMTQTQVAVFGNKLWTSWVDGQGDLTDFFQNFWLVATGQTDTGSMDIGAMMQFIVSLQVFPFVIPEMFGTQVNEIKVGRGVLPIDMQTAPNVLRLTTSNIYLGCGSRLIPRPYGDYRDYTNITITAYLPFVGTCELNAADVVGRTLTCDYFIDLYTGGCTAYMMAFDDEGHNYPVCQMDGSIGATLPVSATNSAQIKTQTISNAMGLASTLAGSYSQHINAGKQAIAGLVSGNGEALAMSAESQFSSKMSALQGVGNFAENVLTQAGVGCPSLAGGKGDLSSFSQPAYPYIQMRYGLYDEPANYNHSVGVPSTKSGTLSGYTGFVVCENVDVSSLTCHTDEKAAIKAALESGVYV